MTQYVLALVLGLLFAIGTFLVLRRDIVRVVWGVSIIGQAANVYLVTMGSFEGGVPFVAHGGGGTTQTDPLVQALVLTAIVIGFGTTAFALVLTYRVYGAHGTIDMDELATSGPTDEQMAATDGGAESDESTAPDGGQDDESVTEAGGDEP